MTYFCQKGGSLGVGGVTRSARTPTSDLFSTTFHLKLLSLIRYQEGSLFTLLRGAVRSFSFR